MFKQGWYENAKCIRSNNFNSRPKKSNISLVIIHCVSLPEGVYENTNVESLFTNRLNYDCHKSFESLRDMTVSAHFYIKRDGKIIQFVSVDDRAWHAGISSFEGKSDCNDFSIGIEMQGTDKTQYTVSQYRNLNLLLQDLKNSYPALKSIAGHEDIAPGRKTDPGIGFDWSKVKF